MKHNWITQQDHRKHISMFILIKKRLKGLERAGQSTNYSNWNGAVQAKACLKNPPLCSIKCILQGRVVYKFLYVNLKDCWENSMLHLVRLSLSDNLFDDLKRIQDVLKKVNTESDWLTAKWRKDGWLHQWDHLMEHNLVCFRSSFLTHKHEKIWRSQRSSPAPYTRRVFQGRAWEERST